MHSYFHSLYTLLSTLWIIYDNLMSQERKAVCLFFVLCFSFPTWLPPPFSCLFEVKKQKLKQDKNQFSRKFHDTTKRIIIMKIYRKSGQCTSMLVSVYGIVCGCMESGSKSAHTNLFCNRYNWPAYRFSYWVYVYGDKFWCLLCVPLQIFIDRETI